MMTSAKVAPIEQNALYRETIPLSDTDISAGRRRMILRSDIAGNVSRRISTAHLLQSPADTEAM